MDEGNEASAELKMMLAQVCAEHSVRIDADDPAVAIVTLNRLMIEAALARGGDQIRAATAELDLALERMQIRAGAMLARDVREAIRRHASQPSEVKTNSGRGEKLGQARPLRRTGDLLFVLAAAAVAFASGIWVGTLVR